LGAESVRDRDDGSIPQDRISGPNLLIGDYFTTPKNCLATESRTRNTIARSTTWGRYGRRMRQCQRCCLSAQLLDCILYGKRYSKNFLKESTDSLSFKAAQMTRANGWRTPPYCRRRHWRGPSIGFPHSLEMIICSIGNTLSI
jgi:hypothetical protein